MTHRIQALACAACALAASPLAPAQDWRDEDPAGYDDGWWDGVAIEEQDDRWEYPDQFGWGENEYGERYGVREWGQSEGDWDYLDDYNYYQDYDPTDNRPIVDPDLDRRYEHESPETDYWYDEDRIDNLRGYGPDGGRVEAGPDPGELPEGAVEDRFHYDDPYIYDPNYDYDVGDSDIDRFQTWYGDEEEGQQRFYDSLRL